MRRGHYRVGICGLVASLTVSVAAALAGGGDRLSVKSKTDVVAFHETRSLDARCPSGTRLVSGGFASEFNAGIGAFTMFRVTASARRGSRSWRTTGYNTGNTPGTLRSLAYCRDQRLEPVRARVPAPVGDFVTATARCPRGTVAVSGGFRASPIDNVGTTPVLYVSESRRAGRRKWETSAFSDGNEEGELTAVALCDDVRLPLARQASTVLSDTPPNTPFDTVAARCPRGRRAVSGGFGSPDDSGMATPAFLTSKRAGSRRWKVSAFYGNNGAPIEATAYAYCERR